LMPLFVARGEHAEIKRKSAIAETSALPGTSDATSGNLHS
jgi:hypothetical protein